MVSLIFAVIEASFWAFTTVVKLLWKFSTLIKYNGDDDDDDDADADDDDVIEPAEGYSDSHYPSVYVAYHSVPRAVRV